MNDTIVRAAEALVPNLAKRIEGLEIPSTDRIRLAAGCFHQALEHHEAIVVLARQDLLGSAMALVRPLFEIYIRGVWLGKCASDSELAAFQNGRIDKRFGELIADIERHEGYDVGVLTKVKRDSWSAMNDFAHGGMLQVTRRITSDSIAPNYGADEVAEMLTFSGAVGFLSTSEVALLAGRHDIATDLLNEMKDFASYRPT